MSTRWATTLFSLTALAPAAARAGCYPLSIPDDDYNGALNSMACCPYEIEQTVPGTVDDVWVDLGISHTFVGDLVVKIQSPATTVSTIQNRAGLAETVDDGAECCGTSPADWNGANIQYRPLSSAPSSELMGSGLATSEFVCTSNGVCRHRPSKGAASGLLPADAFDGQAYAGTWQLCVGDGGPQDQGSVTSGDLVPILNRRIPCVCGGKFRGGDRVKYSQAIEGPTLDNGRNGANPEGTAVPPPEGATGEVMCGLESFYILVKWDAYTGGHDGFDNCSCPTGGLPDGTNEGYYVTCVDLLLDLPWSDSFESGDRSHWTATSPPEV